MALSLGRIEDAERHLERGVEFVLAGGVTEDVLNVMKVSFRVSYAFQAQGRFAEAERLAIRGVTVGEKAFGATHPEVATGLDKLAWLYYCRREYGAAEPLLKRAS